MRSVKRLDEPQSLKTNSAIWTKELLDEVKRLGDYSKVSDSYKSKYNQTDVKNVLIQMYTNHCCYCEGLLGAQTYGRIEHLRPKSLPQFHKLTFAWDNLHWCCEKCNTNKGKKWDLQFPILDPTQDNISDHIAINIDSGEYELVNNSQRGQTTINHTDLNRDDLVEARRKLTIKISKYFSMLPTEKRKSFLDIYKAECEDNSYPSVIVKTCEILESFINV